MSILLDALKKSEEQRHLGKTPDVHAPSDHDPDKGRAIGPAWIPATLMVVAAILIFWFTWTQYREPEVAVVSGQPVAAQREPGAAPPAQAAEAEAGRPPRSPVETLAAPEEQPAPDAPAEDPAKSMIARQFNQFQRPATEEIPAQQQPPPPSSATAGPQPRPEPQSGESTGPSPSTEPRGIEPVSYWELPQNVRDGMPEFNITVMVYADAPADRFMLINGQRLRERESLGGVELEEIRRDGAVFRYRNYRFLVKG